MRVRTTRHRADAELAGARRMHDPTLVCHVYDLHIICEHDDAAEVAVLAREIMLADAEIYGDRLAADRDNPRAETRCETFHWTCRWT